MFMMIVLCDICIRKCSEWINVSMKHSLIVLKQYELLADKGTNQTAELNLKNYKSIVFTYKDSNQILSS